MLEETRERISLMQASYIFHHADFYMESSFDNTMLTIYFNDKMIYLKTIQNDEENCMICFEKTNTSKANDLNTMQATLCQPVTHKFCRRCILKWIDSCSIRSVEISCPVCRILLF